MTELVATAKGMLMVSRRKTAPIGQLSPKQLDWCAANLKGFAWPRVSRLADHEKASAAYRLAELIDDARERMEATV